MTKRDHVRASKVFNYLVQGHPPRRFSRLSQLIFDVIFGRAWKTASEIVITFPIPLASMYAFDTAALDGFTRAR